MVWSHRLAQSAKAFFVTISRSYSVREVKSVGKETKGCPSMPLM